MKRFLLLCLLFVPLSLMQAQGVEQTGGDSITNQTDSTIHQSSIVAVSHDMESGDSGDEEKCEEEDLLDELVSLFSWPMVLGSLILVVGLFVLYRKMNEKKNTSEGKVKSESRKSPSGNAQLDSKIKDLLAKQEQFLLLLNECSTKIDRLIQAVDRLDENRPEMQVYQKEIPLPDVVLNNPDTRSADVKTDTSLEESVEHFFVQPSLLDGRIILKVINDSRYYNQVAFEMDVKGSIGTYKFNEKALDIMLKYLEVKVVPFSTCEIESSQAVSNIQTLENGEVKKYEDNWEVTKRAKLRVF